MVYNILCHTWEACLSSLFLISYRSKTFEFLSQICKTKKQNIYLTQILVYVWMLIYNFCEFIIINKILLFKNQGWEAQLNV